ncbi:hypothetical protein A3G67_03375 [Candidatus Roizmanbacteria bacterium RIFCSPLOWO2_12_FULL_40_12]|uniref:Ribonuclease J n=1 Tax=Candidatus Roizmanbacteria bacterium RIFCSPLOWO2_01_FULL_40_42 TaxID=1802066 RepID=A0A1F7J5I9_9BACT|nr:MAG: hypothetical protein A2779_03010 [Candidatus Roizmanbacteria bacterium RIFCSPHIGHO2_01_FULL_40_98]OGK28311.1 MAG: hypothetical protein A3C31_00375 [Candidatus Roizmanbacteria bacterium RIFCSPHIGHO2_02_FULL_40_53]OGK30547.1 MAG: hypothetical protein A2W49_03060 [Candidatus Roizmanbacteria bacterium RIFCSPHIGHO2_12_41_18]OGK36961.1 MAG: hypothetical protein A3E69_00635 [Candidatus Roizmanbacteria bacterium RIFCSPHIGHO2_12_FULL_40_130]OGK50867.1 MAG: hypothetical protein A3B50_01145 [Candi
MASFRLRFVPLGGVVGVTKNMYLYELYEDQKLLDILIVDCGIGFPQDKALGVDFVIPDISYLQDKKDKIRAVLLSHGHEDHISALPYHYDALGKPAIYTSKLTAAFVNNKFKETERRVQVNQVDYDHEYQFGQFKVQFIHLTHSIPDTMHIFIKTPVGNIYHGPDFKFDLTPPYGKPPDFYKILNLSHEGVLCLMSDCLGVDRPGATPSESIVGQTFEDVMRTTKGKFIMSTFSSNISRIRQCVEAAVKFNRKIVFMGRSMRDNTKLAQQIGYLPIPQPLMVKEEQVMRIPPNKVCLIVAGSQGQYNSALAKLATNQNKNIKIKQGDKIIFSSDPVPGNENEVYSVIEEIIRTGAEVVYPDLQDQLHASGHGNQEDIKLLIRFTNPKYFIPIGGTIRHQQGYQRLAVELGHPKESVYLLDEGNTVIFEKNTARIGTTVETKNVYVDAYGIGDVGNVVLRDRKTLSTDGIVFATLILDSKVQMIMPTKFATRGFVFEKGEEVLFKGAENLIASVLKPKSGKTINPNSIKKEVADRLEAFFFQEKGRKPLIMVEILQI